MRTCEGEVSKISKPCYYVCSLVPSHDFASPASLLPVGVMRRAMAKGYALAIMYFLMFAIPRSVAEWNHHTPVKVYTIHMNSALGFQKI